MLSANEILEYIKDDILFPFQKLEWDDPKIIDYLTKFTLKRTFSQYIPQKWVMNLDVKSPDVVTEQKYVYKITEPDDCSILNVMDFISGDNMIIFGHPPVGTFSYGALENWYLNVNQARTTHLSSEYYVTFRFIPPDMIWINPDVGGGVLYYERAHPHFGTVPPEHEDRFLRLSSAEIKMKIGKIRKRFSGIETPFGSIPLNGEDLYNEGKEEYEKIIEELKTVVPNVIIDVG